MASPCPSIAPSTCSWVVLIRPSRAHCLADQNSLLSPLLSAIRCYAANAARREGLGVDACSISPRWEEPSQRFARIGEDLGGAGRHPTANEVPASIGPPG